MKTSGRFRFSLETVLRVRALREEQAQLELAGAQLQLERSRQALADTEAYFARTLARLKEAASQDFKAPDYLRLCHFLEHLKLALACWRERVQLDAEVVQEKQAALERRHQERRLLERLREKKYAEFKRELNKFLEKQTEAIVLARWPRA